jgi:hypothetical protein
MDDLNRKCLAKRETSSGNYSYLCDVAGNTV